MERRRVPSGWHRVTPPSRPVLFVNPRSGDGTAARVALAEHARDRGIRVVMLEGPGTLQSLVDSALAEGADALGMAGGDGSLAVVASAAAARGLPFVCVPAGTRNHFALDAGIDRHDPVGALDAFTDGMERTIDLAAVNGRIFVNNVSLGVYGDAVHDPAYRGAKVHTILETFREVAGPGANPPPLELLDDTGRRHAHPVVLLISNNPYAVGTPVVGGTRPGLDGGRLGVLVVDPPRGPPPKSRMWTARSLDVGASAPVAAGIDGEAVLLAPPLHFESRPAALRIRISRRHPGISPSARALALRPGQRVGA